MKAVIGGLVVLVALTVGIIHFALDFVLFGGRFISSARPPGPPSGGPPPAPRPGPPPGSIARLIGPHLPELFVANLAVFVILAILLLALTRAHPSLRVAVNVLIILAAVATLIGWNGIGRPNPRGLGHWAVGLEAALIVLAAVHAALVARRGSYTPLEHRQAAAPIP